MVFLGLFVLVAAQDVRPASVYDPIGSRGGPHLVGALMLIGGVMLVLRRLLGWYRESPLVAAEGTEDDKGVPPGSAVRALSIWAAAVAYVVVMPVAGYLLATPVFVAVVLRLFAVRRPLMLAAVPVGFTVPVFLVFVLLLRVRLPTGILDEPLRQLGLV